jgi:hypothetical protein
MAQGKVRALVGARVSSVQGDEKTSHITKRGKGESYAESQDWTVVGALEDLDVSAINLLPWDRPDLKTWLTDRADALQVQIALERVSLQVGDGCSPGRIGPKSRASSPRR